MKSRIEDIRSLVNEANAHSAPEVGHCMFCLGQMDGKPCPSYDGRPHELCGCGNTEGDLPILVIGAEPCSKIKTRAHSAPGDPDGRAS